VSTTIDLDRLGLKHGDGARLDLDLPLEPLELGGQTYAFAPNPVRVRLDVSRPSRGYAFHLEFPLRVEGPCMRCLEEATLEVEVDAREVDQVDAEDEELRSPYVDDAESTLEIGRWAHDAAILALPEQVLCRPDCAGLCPGCGEPLNDADPADHEHESAPDPRWAKLDELKLD
jgi:uncharacterized protein